MTESTAYPDAPTPSSASSMTVRRWQLFAALLTVAAALIALGVIALVRNHTLRHDGPLHNQALVDRSATSQVTGQVTTALNAVLSYDYAHPQVAQAAAKQWLAGDAPGQYKILFAALQKAAKGQNLTLVAKVATAGVTSLQGDNAQLLVFVDQASTRASTQQTTVSAAQVQIGARRYGKTWKITELQPL